MPEPGHSQDFDEKRFPDARWDRHEVSSILRELLDRFQMRDERIMLREALVFRRTWDEHQTGQYVPPPFDKSHTIIKHASGILIDRAQHLAAKAAENPPNVRVNVLTSSNGHASEKAIRDAGTQQAALDAIEYENDLAADQPPQEIAAFFASVLGVGWYHEYEHAAGWKVPDRKYYDELSDEELEQMRKQGKLVTARDRDGNIRPAEPMDLWERRKDEAMRENADRGESLTVQEVLHPGSVYYRKDTQGYSLVAIVEEVPQWDMHNEFGVVEDEHGDIVIGADQGGPAYGLEVSGKTWIRVRIWTRDEVYYYVSRHQGGKPTGAGEIVWHSKHDYGEPPFWPAAAFATGSAQPEEEFTPLLEGAYAMVPGYNQVLTLLSNAAIVNTTPRYILVRNDGTPVLDGDGATMFFETDNINGLSPDLMAVIEGGGQLQQAKVENVGDIVALLEVYSKQLDDTLPSDSARGASGQHEPAWGTRLKQAAENVKIAPLVKKHARAKIKQNRWRSRIIKHRGRAVTLYSRPGRQGEIAHARKELTLKPDQITLNISVGQDQHDAQERITMMQVMTEMYNAGLIGPIEFYRDGMGKDDPLAAYQEAVAGQLANAIYQNVTIPRVMQRVQGRLTQRTPNEIQTQAEQNARPDVMQANPAEAAGIRSPGVGDAPTQDSLPQLSGPGAAPLNGAQPV